MHVAYAGKPGDADIALDGTSLQNCIDANVDRTGSPKPASVDPPNLLDLDNCGDANILRQNGRGIYEPGDPVVSIMTALNAAGITEPKDYKGPGPRPGALASMPNPCATCKQGSRTESLNRFPARQNFMLTSSPA